MLAIFRMRPYLYKTRVSSFGEKETNSWLALYKRQQDSLNCWGVGGGPAFDIWRFLRKGRNGLLMSF